MVSSLLLLTRTDLSSPLRLASNYRHEQTLSGKKAPVHVWMLVVGAIMLVIGFVTYG